MKNIFETKKEAENFARLEQMKVVRKYPLGVYDYYGKEKKPKSIQIVAYSKSTQKISLNLSKKVTYRGDVGVFYKLLSKPNSVIKAIWVSDISLIDIELNGYKLRK